MKSFALGLLIGLVASCAHPRIVGLTDSNLYTVPPKGSTYKIEKIYGDEIASPKIEKMIRNRMKKIGFAEDLSGTPDIILKYVFDVVGAGNISIAQTLVHNPYTSGVTTVREIIGLYKKSIAVRLEAANTGEKLWEAVSEEAGACDRILVTAPDLLSTLFGFYPQDVTNARSEVFSEDPGAQELRGLFPGSNWSCE